MSRIEQCFQNLKSANKTALIPYITAGDPILSATVPTMHAMVEQGADILEIGVPFSDPMADGPVIQLACERALANGTSLTIILELIKEFREKDESTPVVLMGYLNPVEVMGYEIFAEAASQAGVDGVLLVDMPPEEVVEVAPLFKSRDLDLIFLLAPTTTSERAAKICSHASGYIYYVSLKGVTGSATLNVGEVAEKVAQIKAHNQIPVGVGFGISNAKSAAEVSKVGDGVIVGSVIVNLIAKNQDDKTSMNSEVKALVSSMRKAMDA